MHTVTWQGPGGISAPSQQSQHLPVTASGTRGDPSPVPAAIPLPARSPGHRQVLVGRIPTAKGELAIRTSQVRKQKALAVFCIATTPHTPYTPKQWPTSPVSVLQPTLSGGDVEFWAVTGLESCGWKT